MNYIIFDLEWNQSPRGKQYSLADMPFEIIEIGAVKLNDQFQITGTFEKIIRPQVYTELHSAVRDMLHINRRELMEGELFEFAAKEFFEWCGDEPVFGTWGTLDLVELQRNVRHYNVDYTFAKPLLYYDVQKLFSIQFQDGKERISLENAVNMMGMSEDSGYHRAINDAQYTANIFKELNMEKVGKFFSIDTYNIPSSRSEEVYLNFGSYGKYVSIGFPTKEAAAADRVVRSAKCFACGKPMKRIIRWFSGNVKSKNSYGLFYCEEHGLIKGRLKIKQSDEGLYYAVRILKRTDEEGAEKIKQRQIRERINRKLKNEKKKDTM